MCSIDLKDAYLTISINSEFTKYLRFIFMDQIYEFTSLPFGLSTALYIFTKLIKTVVAKLLHNFLN